MSGCDHRWRVLLPSGQDGEWLPTDKRGEICWRCKAVRTRHDWEDEYGPVCPDTGQYAEDCPMCQGEACKLCGAGLSNDTPHCEHDVVERHTGLAGVPRRAGDGVAEAWHY